MFGGVVDKVWPDAAAAAFRQEIDPLAGLGGLAVGGQDVGAVSSNRAIDEVNIEITKSLLYVRRHS